MSVVVVLMTLYLLGLNLVVMALLIFAIVVSLTAGIGVSGTFIVLAGGMAGAAQTTLSYYMLVVFAAAISKTDLTNVMPDLITRVVKGQKILLVFILMIAACMSGTIISIHIAFIPLLVPPLLPLLDKLKVDRRQIACALGLG